MYRTRNQVVLPLNLEGSKRKYENIIADAGYASEEYYTYLELQGQRAYIKPAGYEVRKKKKFKNDIYREVFLIFNILQMFRAAARDFSHLRQPLPIL